MVAKRRSGTLLLKQADRCSDKRGVAKAARPEREGGFTLIELMVALLVLAVIMAAIAPAFYGTLKATSSTDQRSTADGLAVAASEQIRSIPYYQVGYSTTPSYCNQSGSTAVLLSYSTPMDSLATSTTVRGTTFQIHSCVYWVAASDGNGQAYKQSVVTILWGNSNQYSYTQTSALYPGGESAYTTAGNNFSPNTTVASGGAAPVPPVVNSAAPFQTSSSDTVTPQTTIQINWQPVNYTSTVQYKVEYWTGSSARPSSPAPTSTPALSGAPDGSGNGTLDYQVGALTPGTTYYFDVIAVAGTQVSQPSNVVSATTNSSSGGSPCTVNSIAVTPSQPVIKNGAPVGWTSLSVAVQATSNCNNLSVQYGINNSSGQPQAPLTTVTLTSSGGSYTGSATQSSWSLSTYGFVVYNNSTATTAQANVTPCSEKGSSGHC